jgi:hypothetical protein
MDGIWQPLPTLATGVRLQETAAQMRTGMLEVSMPVDWLTDLGGYLTVETNSRHALAGMLSAFPSRSWLSRTITVFAVLATSTHSPPFAPE